MKQILVESRRVIDGNASVCIFVCHARSLVLRTVLTNFNLSANTSSFKDVGLKSPFIIHKSRDETFLWDRI